MRESSPACFAAEIRYLLFGVHLALLPQSIDPNNLWRTKGLSDGIFIYRDKKRPSFCTLFVSDDNGEHWNPDVVFAQSHPGSPVVPSDSPVFVPLKDGRIFCVMQALDRRDEHHPLAGFSKEMSLIGNILEPTAH